jgi:hypothetical protein
VGECEHLWDVILETGRLVPDDPSLTYGLTADDGTDEIFGTTACFTASA